MSRVLQPILLGVSLGASVIGLLDSLGADVQTAAVVLFAGPILVFFLADYLIFRSTGSSPLTRRSQKRSAPRRRVR